MVDPKPMALVLDAREAIARRLATRVHHERRPLVRVDNAIVFGPSILQMAQGDLDVQGEVIHDADDVSRSKGDFVILLWQHSKDDFEILLIGIETQKSSHVVELFVKFGRDLAVANSEKDVGVFRIGTLGDPETRLTGILGLFENAHHFLELRIPFLKLSGEASISDAIDRFDREFEHDIGRRSALDEIEDCDRHQRFHQMTHEFRICLGQVGDRRTVDERLRSAGSEQ